MSAVPPKIVRPSRFSRWAGIIVVALILGTALTVFFFDPATTNFYPLCQFHRLTGLNCPGCGATRAVYALLHDQWLVALHDNALFVFALVGLLIRAAWFVLNRLRGRQNGEFFPAQYLWWLLGLAGLFGVLRNLPGMERLSP